MDARVIRFAFVLLLCLSGCLYQPNGGDVPAPEPDGEVSAVASAAELSARKYPALLAKNARELSEKTGEFKSNADLYEALQEANARARAEAFQPLADASDRAVRPDGEYDQEAVRKLLSEQADGFERVSNSK